MSVNNISDDDDSFTQNNKIKTNVCAAEVSPIAISSDEDGPEILYELTSDEDDLPKVSINAKKQALIRNLFPTAKPKPNHKCNTINDIHSNNITATTSTHIPKSKGFEKMIGGIKVNLPVEPYGSQTALMFKVITAINKGQNCLLESPTGSGKTLALLCSALAWLRHERNRVVTIQAQTYLEQYPVLMEEKKRINSFCDPSDDTNISAETLFTKPVFGQKSIYDSPGKQQNFDTGDSHSSMKRQEPLHTSDQDSPNDGLVKIHKKRKLNTSELAGSSTTTSPESPSTPEKNAETPQPETPQSIRNLYHLVDSLRLRTSMIVDCSVPTIFYGARTHKQLQQVIKEFARTDYCGEAKMTILSSRDYSCIREFDRKLWKTKNDMCRGCVKTFNKSKGNESNCTFYNNRLALNHKSLPPAFDLDELVAAGEKASACPFFGARAMMSGAQIVFCPYNYLIEPSIRNSLQIDLHNNIVIIDEAHNIEDICRDSATFTFTRDNIQAAMKELEVVAGYRYANHEVMSYIEYLLRTLRYWDDWFVNQTPLVKSRPVVGNEAVFTWQVEHFIQTLNNHNIGQLQYNEFRQNAEIFCRRLREDPRTLVGVTQATGSLIESIDTVLGYLFRSSGRYMDDFTPAFIRTVYGGVDTLSEAVSWRSSQFNKSIESETLALRLMCMNPAVVFEGLKTAKCIILASGTLTPLVSLHSELATEFPLQVSPNHVIPSDRVWIGSLGTCPNGRKLECTSRGTEQLDIQDALGSTILWISRVTPNGVLCFLPSYVIMNKLSNRWRETGIWSQINDLKHVFMESRNVRDHNDIMEDYYNYASTNKGALLFAVYRGKVSEGMDFKDHQARAVITVGVPYPNTFDMAVKEKMKYNDKYSTERKLLSSREWLRVQAYRALNQAVGRCVRHRGDWGAVLLVDARFSSEYYTEHLSKWVRNFLGNNHHTFDSLTNSANSLESFMQNMRIRENEDI